MVVRVVGRDILTPSIASVGRELDRVEFLVLVRIYLAVFVLDVARELVGVDVLAVGRELTGTFLSNPFPRLSRIHTPHSSPFAQKTFALFLFMPSEAEDPELNDLRREVRRLQSDVRTAQLASATQQEELIDLRAELAASNARGAELEERLGSERERVRGTLRAAEVLVESLRGLGGLGVGGLQDGIPRLRLDERTGEILSGSGSGSDGSDCGSEGGDSAGGAMGSPRREAVASPQMSPRVSQETATRMLRTAAESVSGGLFGSAVGASGEAPIIDVSELLSPGNGREGVTFGKRLQKMTLAYTVPDAHEGDIYAVGASADGALVASGGDDRVLKVFDVGLRKGVARLTESCKAVTAVAFDGGGDVLVSGSFEGMVRVYRRSGKGKWALGSVLPAHTGVVRRLLSVGGSAGRFVTASLDRTVCMTDIGAGKKVFAGHAPSAAMDVGIMPGGGECLVSGHKDGSLRMWSTFTNDRDGGAVDSAAKVHRGAITSVSCLEDGFGVVSLGRDGLVKLSDVRSLAEPVREMDGSLKVVSDWHRAALSGRVVAFGLAAGPVCHFQIDSGKVFREKLVASSVKGPDGLHDLLQSRNPGTVLLPYWTPNYLVAAHRSGQLSFWQ